MDIEKYKELDILKNKKNDLIYEQSLLNKGLLLRKQISLYVIGLYGTTIVSSLLFSHVTLLNVLFPIMFAVSTPIIMKKKNKKKLNELEIEINNLNNQIIEMKKELSKEEKNDKQNRNINNKDSMQIKQEVKRTNVPYFESDLTIEEDRPKLVKSIFPKNPNKM